MALKGYKYAQKSRNRNRVIGQRSIHDIISRRDMSYGTKLNYIRHHYTYYDGNHQFFHNANGKPNASKHILNEAIKEVIHGRVDPSVLGEINKLIMEWRKEQQ